MRSKNPVGFYRNTIIFFETGLRKNSDGLDLGSEIRNRHIPRPARRKRHFPTAYLAIRQTIVLPLDRRKRSQSSTSCINRLYSTLYGPRARVHTLAPIDHYLLSQFTASAVLNGCCNCLYADCSAALVAVAIAVVAIAPAYSLLLITAVAIILVLVTCLAEHATSTVIPQLHACNCHHVHLLSRYRAAVWARRGFLSKGCAIHCPSLSQWCALHSELTW